MRIVPFGVVLIPVAPPGAPSAGRVGTGPVRRGDGKWRSIVDRHAVANLAARHAAGRGREP